MANDCTGTMKVVCRTGNETAIDRLARIMRYKDPEWYMYRVFEFCENDPGHREHTEDGFTVATFSTSVAWSGWRWFDTDRSGWCMVGEKNPKGTDFLNLCRLLGIGVEYFATEVGCQFAEHYLCDSNGSLLVEESAHYEEVYPLDENGEPDYSQDCEERTDLDLWDFRDAAEIFGGSETTSDETQDKTKEEEK